MKFLNWKILQLIKQLLERNLHHFLVIYLFSLLIVILFWSKYDKLALLLTIVLFNLNSLIYTRLWRDNLVKPEKERTGDFLEKQLHNQIANFEWLQAIINQIWPGELAILFQKELNKFYAKNRNTEFKFYHFYLDENSPPQVEQLYIPLESMRKDEIVIHLRVTIVGTVLLKLNEDEKNKADLTFVNLLIKKYGFRKKFQTGIYQDASLKKKNFLTKEFCLNGRSRVILRPLINHMPYFTSLNFTLLDYPLMYSNDKLNLHESSDEFESKFYNYLIERICVPFLHPNRLILLYAHRYHIKAEHGQIFRKKLSEANQFMQSKLRRLIKHKRGVNDLMLEMNDRKIMNWHQTTVMRSLDMVELNLNNLTFHPFPLFILRIKLIELENIISDCVLYIRIRVGQFSITKIRLTNATSPILNLTALLPVHDYYEQCTIQLIQIRSFKLKQVKKTANELNSVFLNPKFLPVDPLIKPIGEITFPIDHRSFDYDEVNYSLNGQDVWLPLDGLQQSMIHLSCACFKLSSAFKTIKKVCKITRALTITKSDLVENLLPVAFVKLYVETFVCTYKKDNKLKSRRDQFNQLQLSLFGQSKTIDLMRFTKTRSIFRSSCHFFAYDDPFDCDLIVELVDKSKGDQTKESKENRIRLLSLIKLSDYKNRTEQANSETLSIFIVNNKEFYNAYLKEKQPNFKLIDRDEYGKLSLNLFIRYVYLGRSVLEKLLLAPHIRGCNLNTSKKRPLTKTIKQDTERLLAYDQKKKSLKTDECVGRLYFKLVDSNTLEVGVVEVCNVPYDKTKRIKLQVIIELWKGNYKVSTNKTSFTDIVHNPTFDSAFQFTIESGNLQQYVIRFVVIQKSGFFRSVLKILADRFCTIPLLTLDINFIVRNYILKSTDKKSNSKKY